LFPKRCTRSRSLFIRPVSIHVYIYFSIYTGTHTCNSILKQRYKFWTSRFVRFELRNECKLCDPEVMIFMYVVFERSDYIERDSTLTHSS
jgi:hypothetical protein